MTILALLLLALLAFLVFKLITVPMKWIFKLLIHALFGFLALFVLNFFSSMLGITVALTLLNALIAGVLGIPGVLLLVLFALF